MNLAMIILAGWVWQTPAQTLETCNIERPGHFYVVEWRHDTETTSVAATYPPEDLYGGVVTVYEVINAKKVKLGDLSETGDTAGCGDMESALDTVLKKAK